MVLVGKVLSLLLFLGIVPFLSGTLLTKRVKKDEENILLNWVAGFIGLMALAQLLIVPATYLELSFQTVMIAFYVISAATAFLGLVQNAKRVGKMLTQWMHSLKKTPLIVWGAVLLVLLQAYIYVRYVHYDADDAFYVATATTTVENNSLYQISPYSGREYPKFPARYVLSPFPVFIAILSRCGMIHPAIVAHTVLPPVLLIFAYAVYALVGMKLFDNDREKTGWMVVFTGLFLAYSGFTTSTQGSLTLLRIWQGKGFLAAALLPMVFYMFLRFLKEEETKADYILLFCLMMACCLATSMGVMLGAILLGCAGLVLVFYRKSLRLLLKLLICAAPNLLFAVVYLMIR